MFLRGLGTEDIRKLAPGFSLAQIVQARVAGEWDRRRAEYDRRLAEQSVDTVNRARLELATFLGDSIAIAAKIGQERLQKYALSRREEDLGGLEVSTIKDLKNALDLLLKTTGQDAPGRKDQPPVNVHGDGATVNVLNVGGGASLADLAKAKKAARGQAQEE